MYLLCAVIALLVLASWPASACTPIVAPALALMLMGTATYGVFVGSAVALPVAIIIKSAIYARFAGYGKGRAAFDMTMGNIGSTIAGALIALMVSSSVFLLLGHLFAAVILSSVAATVFSRDAKVMSPVKLSGLTCAAMIASLILLAIAYESDPEKIGIVASETTFYWGFKIVGVFFALVATLAVSVVFEGSVIFRMHAKDESFPRKMALEAILKANLWTFLLISVAGALIALPVRWSTPGFLDLHMNGLF